MKVSLCGPHSFETSTLLPAAVDVVLSGAASPPLSRMNSYLLHHVGSCELFCADTFAGRYEIQMLSASNANNPRIAKLCFFVMMVLPGRFDQLLVLKGVNLGVDSISTGHSDK